MAREFKQGVFEARNPAKMASRRPPVYRSSWELVVMRFLDDHPSIVEWGSECLKIPYYNPLKMRHSVYVPDFLVRMNDRTGVQRTMVVEVKPSSQTLGAAKSQRDKMEAVVNAAKWRAAVQWCRKRGMTFDVMTESDIFRMAGGGRRTRKARKPKVPGRRVRKARVARTPRRASR